MRENRGDHDGSFEERLAAARGRRGLDGPPKQPGNVPAVSKRPLGDRPAGRDRAGLGPGRGGRHRLRARPAVRHHADSHRRIRACWGARLGVLQRLAHVRAAAIGTQERPDERNWLAPAPDAAGDRWRTTPWRLKETASTHSSQFKLVPGVGLLGRDASVHFSNSNLMMLVAGVLTLAADVGRHEPARHDPGPAAIRRRNGLRTP